MRGKRILQRYKNFPIKDQLKEILEENAPSGNNPFLLSKKEYYMTSISFRNAQKMPKVKVKKVRKDSLNNL